VPIYPNIRHVQNHPKECHRYQCKPFRHDPRSVPSVFGRNLQCQPVRRVNTREECHWSHACSLQANIRGIQWHLECKFVPEKKNCT
jgi:hypothetical protein